MPARSAGLSARVAWYIQPGTELRNTMPRASVSKIGSRTKAQASCSWRRLTLTVTTPSTSPPPSARTGADMNSPGSPVVWPTP
ncbi:hypothetical protein D9M72_348360 [compost metagenome]